MFQLIVLLIPDFDWCNRFQLSWVDKVNTRTLSFISVIGNVPGPAEMVITQVNYHARMRSVSQLISAISIFLQKLLKNFNGNAISTSFLLPSATGFSVTPILEMNDAQFTTPVLCSSSL